MVGPTRFDLHVAIGIGMSKSTQIATLLQNGCTVNDRDVEGNTPLHTAASLGKVEVVNALIKGGANVHALNYIGNTPLWVAVKAFYGQTYLDTCVSLVRAGSNINFVGNNRTQTNIFSQEQLAPRSILEMLAASKDKFAITFMSELIAKKVDVIVSVPELNYVCSEGTLAILTIFDQFLAVNAAHQIANKVIESDAIPQATQDLAQIISGYARPSLPPQGMQRFLLLRMQSFGEEVNKLRQQNKSDEEITIAETAHLVAQHNYNVMVTGNKKQKAAGM
jgi:hypothetical protein